MLSRQEEMSAFRSYGTTIIKSPNPMEIEHDNIPWNKSRIIGQKRPLQISHIWGIRIRLELEGKVRDLALLTWLWTVNFGAAIWLS